MMTSSPGLVTASSDAIMVSVDPQQTVTLVSGSTSSCCQIFAWRAMASRSDFAPHVMAYWLTSAAMAAWAACLISAGRGKIGESLGQVDGAVLLCLAGHFPDHGLGEAPGFFTDVRFARARGRCGQIGSGCGTCVF